MKIEPPENIPPCSKTLWHSIFYIEILDHMRAWMYDGTRLLGSWSCFLPGVSFIVSSSKTDLDGCSLYYRPTRDLFYPFTPTWQPVYRLVVSHSWMVVTWKLQGQGFPKHTKFCSQFPSILLTKADLNSQLYRKQWQNLVTQSRDYM